MTDDMKEALFPPSVVPGKAWQSKVAAYVLQERAGLHYLLLHSFVSQPELPWRVPGGTVEAGEVAEGAVLRELREEAGLTQLQIVKKLGSLRYYKAYLDANVERQDFLLVLKEPMPDSWRHSVRGSGDDQGEVFAFHWRRGNELKRLAPELSHFVHADYMPELFNTKQEDVAGR